jgi:hypothetical protein
VPCREAAGDRRGRSLVAENPGERAALEFAVKRDDERNCALVVFETHVATALANGNPPDLLESVDQLLAG